MVGYRQRDDNRRMVEESLETPRVVGYRNGMTAVGLIGHRLARVYDVTSDMPRDMGVALRTIDDKVGGSR